MELFTSNIKKVLETETPKQKAQQIFCTLLWELELFTSNIKRFSETGNFLVCLFFL